MQKNINPRSQTAFPSFASSLQISQVKARVSQISLGIWTVPVGLFFLSVLTYGLLIPWLVFYWYDWPVVLLARLNDPATFLNYYVFDRPFSAWTFLPTVPFLGTTPLNWHIFTLVLRWLVTVGIWWMLRGVWPKHNREVTWMAFLFLVYPGFKQQAVSIAYSQHFTTYALFAFSMGAMIWAIRRPRWFLPLMGISVLASAVHLFTMEYFSGLELLRPLLLWIVFKQKNTNFGKTLRSTFQFWLPFAIVLLTFVVWRFGIYGKALGALDENNTGVLSALLANPITGIQKLLQLGLQDFVHDTLNVWMDTVLPESAELLSKAHILSLFLGSLCAGLIVVYMSKLKQDQGNLSEEQDLFVLQALLVGTTAVILGGLPVWLTNRQAIVGAWSDRFTLAPMLGACILLGCLVEWFVHSRNKKAILFGVLIGLAVSSQVRISNKYRLNWEIQKDFFWQLVWRAPNLQTGTILLSPEMPFGLVGDYSIASAINVIYAPPSSPTGSPYWFLNAPRYRGGVIPDFEEGLPIIYTLRTMAYFGSTSQSLVVTGQPQSACVRVLDAIDGSSLQHPPGTTGLLSISHLERILPGGANDAKPPVNIFGEEPAHTWCYYYEKADLANQYENWPQVVQLWEQAQVLGFQPNSGAELLPFISGHAYTGNWDQSLNLTRQAYEKSYAIQPTLCAVWHSLLADTNPPFDQLDRISQMQTEIECQVAQGLAP